MKEPEIEAEQELKGHPLTKEEEWRMGTTLRLLRIEKALYHLHELLETLPLVQMDCRAKDR